MEIFMKINKFLTVILSGFLFSSIIAADAANPPKNNKSKKNNTKQVFTIKEINLEMIDCPAGSFMMGSPENEIGKYTDEIYHKVNISKPFKISKYEITQKQYEAIIGCNPSNFKGASRPVEKVSWKEAQDFCKILNKKYEKYIPAGYKFDLPTEAQWEYACRAGTTTSLNSGKNITSRNEACPNVDEVAWYDKNSKDETHPVGQKKPNSWGIYDMHGNVWEWVKDYYNWYPETEVTDPVCNNAENLITMFRGGSYGNDNCGCRSAARCYYYPESQYEYVGFRVALVPIN